MIGVKQTVRGGPDAPPGRRGNCFGAALASLLEVPMSQIPNPPLSADITVHDSSPWWEHYDHVCREFGYMMTDLPMDTWWDWMDEHKPGMHWLAGVYSLNIQPTEAVPKPIHAVVMRDTTLLHDPSRANRYEAVTPEDVTHGTMLIALNPAMHT